MSNIVNLKIYRAQVDETTALGAAFMAGLYIGVYKSLIDINNKWKGNRIFKPKLKNLYRKKLINEWTNTVKKTLIH